MVSLQINITAVDILKLELQASYCLLAHVNIIVGKHSLIVYHLVVIRINGYLFLRRFGLPLFWGYQRFQDLERISTSS